MNDASTMTLRARMRDILMSDACQRINFSLDGITINGSGYAYVALTLISKPTAHGGLKFSTYVQKYAGATFNSETRTFAFPTFDYAADADSLEAMTVVHESTHALIAALKGTRILRTSNEVCAHIAECLYNIYRGRPNPMPLDYPPAAVAERIVRIAEQWNYNGTYALDNGDVASSKEWLVTNKAYEWLKGQPKYIDKNGGVPLS